MQYLILKLFTNRFDLFNCIFALGVTVFGLQSKVRGAILYASPCKVNMSSQSTPILLNEMATIHM